MPTRRHFLSTLVAAPNSAPTSRAIGCAAQPTRTDAGRVDEHDLTPDQTEGPYFSPNSPEKQDFAADAPGGQRITLAGYVLTTDCQPAANFLVELWHADETGNYDNSGYKLRGHQFTDVEGRWWFDTIVPGLYPGRTRHFHIKVQRLGADVLTTQLYFPGEPDNARDCIFNEALLLGVSPTGRANLVVMILS